MQQVIGVTNQDWGKGGSNAAFFVGLSRDPVVLVGCAAIPGTATGFECRNSGLLRPSSLARDLPLDPGSVSVWVRETQTPCHLNP